MQLHSSLKTTQGKIDLFTEFVIFSLCKKISNYQTHYSYYALNEKQTVGKLWGIVSDDIRPSMFSKLHISVYKTNFYPQILFNGSFDCTPFRTLFPEHTLAIIPISLNLILERDVFLEILIKCYSG